MNHIQQNQKVCPVCEGKGKETDLISPEFTLQSHWEFIDKEMLKGVTLVCDACNGSGLYCDYVARVLSGEFPTPPHKTETFTKLPSTFSTKTFNGEILEAWPSNPPDLKP